MPFNNAENNLGTVYYQSYNFFKTEFKNYVNELSKNEDGEHTIEITTAAAKLEGTIYSSWLFQIAQQTTFRNTIFSERVLKDDAWTKNNNLTKLIGVLEVSRSVFQSEEINDQDEFIQANKDILEAIEPEILGFDSGKKTYEVTLKEGSSEKLEAAIKKLLGYLEANR